MSACAAVEHNKMMIMMRWWRRVDDKHYTACADFPTSVELADDNRTGGRHNCITYLLTDVVAVAHCHACHTHIRLLIFLRSDSANRHILGCGDPGMGPMTPKFELGRDFCTMHLTAKFHHPTFSRSELSCWQTDKLTNKQTDAAENIHLAPLRYAGGQKARVGLTLLPYAYNGATW